MIRARWMLSCLIVLLFHQQSSAQSLGSIYETFRNTPLIDVLTLLKSKYDVDCNFRQEVVAGQLISVQLDRASDSAALAKILEHTGLIALRQTEAPKRVFSIVPRKWKTQHLHGRITNKETGEGMSGVGVVILEKDGSFSRYGAYTEEDGSFSIHFEVETGRPYIEFLARMLFYEDVIQKVNLPIQSPIEIEISVSPNSRFGISIEENHPRPLAKPEGISQGSSIRLSPDQLTYHGGMGEPDIMRSAQLVPGVQSINESASDLYIRGGAPEHNLVLLDGMPIYHSGHFFGMVGQFNPRAIQEFEIFRGGFDARYGGRLSSVINITGKPDAPRKLRFGGGVNALNGNLFVETPLKIGGKKAGIMIAVRRSATDLISTPLYENFFNQVFQSGVIKTDLDRQRNQLGGNLSLTPRLMFGDINAKFILEASKKDRLIFSLFGGFDRLDYENRAEDGSEYVEINTDRLTQYNQGSSLQWNRKWTSTYTTETNLTYSSFTQKHGYQMTSIYGEDDGFQMDYASGQAVEDLSLKQHHNWEINGQHRLEVGTELSRLSTRRSNSLFQTSLGNLDSLELSNVLIGESALIGSAYFQESFQSESSPVSLRWGMRYTYYSPTRQHFLAPRVSMNYELSDKLSLNASWGRYRQFLNRILVPNQLQVGQDFWMLADGDSLPVASAYHLIAGLTYSDPKHWLLEAELYHKSLADISTYSLAPDLTNGGLSPQALIAGGFGTAKGIDLMINRRMSLRRGESNSWGSTNVGIAYSLSQVTYSFPQIEKSREFFADHDQRHVLKLYQEITLSRWSLTTSWVYASGRPFTEAIEALPADDSHSREQTALLYGDRNLARLPAYHRLDVTFAYKFTLLSSKRPSDIGISVFNVYNRRNIKSRQFFGRSTDNGGAPSYQISSVDRLLLGISPNVFLNLNF